MGAPSISNRLAFLSRVNALLSIRVYIWPAIGLCVQHTLSRGGNATIFFFFSFVFSILFRPIPPFFYFTNKLIIIVLSKLFNEVNEI